MKTKERNLWKIATLAPLAGLLMGNQSCQKQDQAQTRELKKIVDLGTISSPNLVIPGVGAFDFKFVANQQIYAILLESEGFALRYLPPVTPASSRTEVLNGLSANDKLVFRKALDGGSNSQVNWSKEASCMVNMPQARLYGSVNSFEMIGGGGISLGFTPSGTMAGTGIGGNLNFQLESAQMDFSLMAAQPVSGGLMAASNVTAKQTKTNINLGINLGMFSLGPSYFYQTPLASVTKNALTLGVKGLKEQLQKEEWFTRVLANHDSHVTIIGGANLNLKKGDEVAIYNELYYWDGEPCASNYRGGGAINPVAIGRIETAAEEISIVKLIQQTDENAVIGAKVKLHRYVEQIPVEEEK
ncbi:MAG: hypothetical protein KF802_05905 [Bdellovibrionaceae bacterium]|nr:hypothetical protein [Pseudobdellovibrionaceae bacterium]MBX3032453.1 hypothetical protein [Pseudobdellovibrionaceae bacterium]